MNAVLLSHLADGEEKVRSNLTQFSQNLAEDLQQFRDAGLNIIETAQGYRLVPHFRLVRCITSPS